MTLAVGSKLGPYEIVGPLGVGGIGNNFFMFFMRARPRHGKSTPSAKKISQKPQGIRR